MQLLIYFLIAYIVIAYVVPFITTLIQKLLYYVKIAIICRKYKYKMVSPLLKWLFSSVSNADPEMFIKTDKAVFSIKNYGFYKKPNQYIFFDKYNIEIHVVRMLPVLFMWLGYSVIKNIRISGINYNNADNYFNDDLPVFNIMLFCPRCIGALRLEGRISAYSDKEHVNTFKVFGRIILKTKFMSGDTSYNPIPPTENIEIIELFNGDLVYGAYIFNSKSFIKKCLQPSSDLLNRMPIDSIESYLES